MNKSPALKAVLSQLGAPCAVWGCLLPASGSGHGRMNMCAIHDREVTVCMVDLDRELPFVLAALDNND